MTIYSSTPTGGIRLGGRATTEVIYWLYAATISIVCTTNASVTIEARADADVETLVDDAVMLSVL